MKSLYAGRMFKPCSGIRESDLTRVLWNLTRLLFSVPSFV